MDPQDLTTTGNASASHHADGASFHENISIAPDARNDEPESQLQVSNQSGLDTAGSMIKLSLFHKQEMLRRQASWGEMPIRLRSSHFDIHQHRLDLKTGSIKNGKARSAHTPGNTTFRFSEAPTADMLTFKRLPDVERPMSFLYDFEDQHSAKRLPVWTVHNSACCRYKYIEKPADDWPWPQGIPTSDMSDPRAWKKNDPHTLIDERQESKDSYLVIGMFPSHESIPKERYIKLNKPDHLFFDLFLSIIKLRGWKFIFSLKDVTQFQLYECYPYEGYHKALPVTGPNVNVLDQFLHTYKSWRRTKYKGYQWTKWIHENLNSSSLHSCWSWCSGESVHLSLRIVLGWSPIRISFAILSPILLSFAVGITINSSDWNNPALIQTAWGVASYVATAGSLLVALLALISSLENSKPPMEDSDRSTGNHEGSHLSSSVPFAPVSRAPENLLGATTELLGALTKQIRHAASLFQEENDAEGMQTLEDTSTHNIVSENWKEAHRLFDIYPNGESFIDIKIEDIWAEAFPIGIEWIAMLNQVDKSTRHRDLRTKLVLIMTEEVISLITTRLNILSATLKLYFMILMKTKYLDVAMLQSSPYFPHLHTDTRNLVVSLTKIQNTYTTSSGFMAEIESLEAADYLKKKILAKAILKAYDEYQEAQAASLYGFKSGDRLKLDILDEDVLEAIIRSEAQALSGR